ncbi:MAG TPA: selenocysteine-specific translation elongation factor [Chthoniobacterales bacterium]|nr:selenocysteine-specific translation elongation factor [Chthoniobacterales bacterium]
MIEKHFILATAGHVDHGKSALVKALTGTDPDRLPEEKTRQITIELGFAQLILDGPDEQRLHIGIVDVPGHEDFVRNMIAGVGSIDLALLVVAADDGWMPQTEEHLQVLTYLGVKRAVVALTKSDLGKIDNVSSQIRKQLRDTAFAHSRIIPTSVRTREGTRNLRNVLAAELSTMQPQRDLGKPRLFVDRAFTLHGIGTVVTGTLTGGQLHRGQSIVVQPQNFEARIRSIQSHGSELESAQPGMRTAINLPDVEIGDAPGRIKRGDVISVVDLGRSSTSLIVLLEKSSRLDRKDVAARPLKNWASVYLHHGTSRFPAKIYLLEDRALEPGKQTIAQVKLESPIFAFLGDRFVLRDASEQHTIAGGIVLDPDGDRGKLRSATQRKLFAERAGAPDGVDLCVSSEILVNGFVRKQTVLRKSHFSTDEIGEALQRLQRRGEIVFHQEIAADAKAWEMLRLRAIGSIDDAHKRNPERAGLELNELRTAFRDQSPDVFEALIVDLCATDFIRRGSGIARVSHRPVLPPNLQPVAMKIREALSAKPFDPPARKDSEVDRHAQEVVRFLIATGEVIDVGPDVVLLRKNFERMKSAIVDFISTNGPATVSELRQALESSRRTMVPFLEKLDREGVTRRVGDKRALV